MPNKLLRCATSWRSWWNTSKSLRWAKQWSGFGKLFEVGSRLSFEKAAVMSGVLAAVPLPAPELYTGGGECSGSDVERALFPEEGALLECFGRGILG